MNMLLGVGNTLRGDDNVGPYVAERLKELKPKGWLAINCGTVPENFTSEIKRFRPELLVIVDAAEMSVNAGEIRIVDKEKIGYLTLSTHSMPLSLFVDYIKNYAKKIVIIGIQPKTTEYGTQMSPEVKKSAHALIGILLGGKLHTIPKI